MEIMGMNISLTPALEKLVHEKVTSGLYNSASEVIREALRLLYERDSIQQKRIEELKKDIEEGLNDIKNGNVHDGEAFMKNLIKRYKN
jgi:antitoxin ParD1/3/4